MNNRLKTRYQTMTICEQPDCLFKKPGFNTRQFTEMLLRQLPKDLLNSIDPGFEQILTRPQCIPCALSVIQGGKACLTEAEWSHLHDMGRWHQRRQRRHKRWGYQPR